MYKVRLTLYMKEGRDITIIRNFDSDSVSQDKYFGFNEIYELNQSIESGKNKVVDFGGVGVPSLNVNHFEYKVL